MDGESTMNDAIEFTLFCFFTTIFIHENIDMIIMNYSRFRGIEIYLYCVAIWKVLWWWGDGLVILIYCDEVESSVLFFGIQRGF